MHSEAHINHQSYYEWLQTTLSLVIAFVCLSFHKLLMYIWSAIIGIGGLYYKHLTIENPYSTQDS